MNKLQLIEREAAEELEVLKTRIGDYDREFRSAFQRQMGFAFLAGVALLRAKEIVPHGKFMQWSEAELSVKRSSVGRYMKFAEALGKLPTVGNLKEVKLLGDGESLSPAQQKKITEAVHELADGKTLTEMYRDLGVIRQADKHGGAREIKFHCPTCNDPLRGVIGAKVTCGGCGNACKAKPDALTPAEAVEARRAMAEDRVNALDGELHGFLNAFNADVDEAWTLEVEDLHAKRLLDSATQLTAWCRKRLAHAGEAKGGRK